MIQSEPIGWWNTGVPLLVLTTLALILPHLLVVRGTRSHRDGAVAVGLTALLVLVAGEVVFALIYAAGGVDVWGALAQAPLATGGFFLRLSAFSALVWVPVLALVWLSLAQKIEARRGADIARPRE